MGRDIWVRLSEIVCIHPNRGRWPNRVLFALAAQADGAPLVALIGPRWMVDGERFALIPPLSLTAEGAVRPAIAVAISGVDLGPEGQWDDRPLARQLVLSTIKSRLSLLPPPPEVGAAWDTGLVAVQDALHERLVQPATPIFNFSKVYPMTDHPQFITLSHSVSDGADGICARYKLALAVEARQRADIRPSASQPSA